MGYHPVVQKILALIKTNNFWFETFEHEPVKTSEQAALTRPGYTLRQGAKAMIVKIYPRTDQHSSGIVRATLSEAKGSREPKQNLASPKGLSLNFDEFVMLVFPADQKFDSKKVLAALGLKNLRFATEAEVTDITGGVQIGGVPPFGNLFNLKVYADPSIFENEKMVFNAGDRGFSVAIKSADYKILVKPEIANLI